MGFWGVNGAGNFELLCFVGIFEEGIYTVDK
jgi:hypothetical protein